MLERFLGIKSLPENSRIIVKRFLYIQGLIVLLFGMGQTFIILHYIQLFDFEVAAFLLAIMFFTQLVTDYPSGSLGDYIGQRTVISVSLVFFCTGYYIVSQTESYTFFILSSICFGLGIGQMSGAMETWLDNNYKISIGDHDPERKLYGFAMMRVGTIAQIIMGSSFVIGGILSTYISRKFVFNLVAINGILLIPIILKYVVNLESPDVKLKTGKSSNYFKFLKGGLQHLISSKKIFFLLLGFAVVDVSGMIWFTLIAFPIFNSYTGTDGGVGFIRAAVFTNGAIISIYSARLSKKISDAKLPLLFLIQILGWFGGILILITLIPPLYQFNLLGIILLLVVFASFNPTFGAIAFTLRQRILLKTTPSEYRNGVYSMLPTISTLIQIPVMIFVGSMVFRYGLDSGLMIIIGIGVIGTIFLFIYQLLDNSEPISDPSVKQEEIVVNS